MSSPSQHVLQAPTGTRDFYPGDLLRLRYIQDAWRRVSVRHGFDEIDGPTFEHMDLYRVKSGEGIVSEVFSFKRFGGEKDFALRPEFTPTLARMYAAKANALPKPTKWFWTQNCFRAERPQRGRLREFYQWNADIMGDESARADAELIACCVDLFRELGLGPEDVKVRISHRSAVEAMLRGRGVAAEDLPAWFGLLDRVGKMSNDAFTEEAVKLGMAASTAVDVIRLMVTSTRFEEPVTAFFLSENAAGWGAAYFQELYKELRAMDAAEWCVLNLGIVRGLAYYTGMVFEVHEATGSERAVAGGGRYDGLVELFGGPPTPAVGFGMGDVVLSLVLQDKGLMPTEGAMAERLGLRPDVYVISNGTEEADGTVSAAVAMLRRAGGVGKGLHVRRSYKATKNVGKLMKDAAAGGARFVVIVESETRATVKNLGTGAQEGMGLEEVAGYVRRG